MEQKGEMNVDTTLFLGLVAASVTFAVICSIVKARWGYSLSDYCVKSPLALWFEKWIGNPLGFLIGFWAVIYFVWFYTGGPNGTWGPNGALVRWAAAGKHETSAASSLPTVCDENGCNR